MNNSFNLWMINVQLDLDFFNKILDVIVHSSTYRDLIDLDPGTDSFSKHVMPFDR